MSIKSYSFAPSLDLPVLPSVIGAEPVIELLAAGLVKYAILHLGSGFVQEDVTT